MMERVCFEDSVPGIDPDAVTEKSITNSDNISVTESLKLKRFKQKKCGSPPSLNIKQRPTRKRNKPDRFGFP